MRIIWGIVEKILFEDDCIQYLKVNSELAPEELFHQKTICYKALCGVVDEGDEVAINTTACDLSLGTGGYNFVVAIKKDKAKVMLNNSSGGHIIKMRYTPHQCDVLSVEEEASEYHQQVKFKNTIDGMKVISCELHSQVIAVALGVYAINPDAHICYIMTDEAALPLALSKVLNESVAKGIIDSTITVGQAFGGEYEAVNMYSGLVFAHTVLNADVAIVGMGPGIVGTNTRLGHGGLAQGEVINAIKVLKGEPIAALRISFADPRKRHYGVSHHTQTALGQIALAKSTVVLPDTLSDDQYNFVYRQLEESSILSKHTLIVQPISAPLDFLGISLSTMGRNYTQDPRFFETAYATGIYAAKNI